MTDAIKIDVWSDIACPWCYIGKRNLENGLAATAADDDAPVVDAPEPAAETDRAEDTAADVADAGVEDEGAEPAPRERAARPAMPAVTPRPRARSAARRASVPSWDEIVFGRKGD